LHRSFKRAVLGGAHRRRGTGRGERVAHPAHGLDRKQSQLSSQAQNSISESRIRSLGTKNQFPKRLRETQRTPPGGTLRQSSTSQGRWRVYLDAPSAGKISRMGRAPTRPESISVATPRARTLRWALRQSKTGIDTRRDCCERFQRICFKQLRALFCRMKERVSLRAAQVEQYCGHPISRRLPSAPLERSDFHDRQGATSPSTQMPCWQSAYNSNGTLVASGPLEASKPAALPSLVRKLCQTSARRTRRGYGRTRPS